jgi:hypothetical protein
MKIFDESALQKIRPFLLFLILGMGDAGSFDSLFRYQHSMCVTLIISMLEGDLTSKMRN